MESKVSFFSCVIENLAIFFPKVKRKYSNLHYFCPKNKNFSICLGQKTEKNCWEKNHFIEFFFSVCNFVMIQKWKKNPEEKHISKVFTKKKTQNIVKIQNKRNHCYGCTLYTLNTN
jgi:hypothetical protein